MSRPIVKLHLCGDEAFSKMLNVILHLNESFEAEKKKLESYKSRAAIKAEVDELKAKITKYRELSETYEKTLLEMEAPLEQLQNERNDLLHAERAITYRSEDENVDVSGLNRDAAQAIYEEMYSSFQNEFKTLDVHRDELNRLEGRKTEIEDSKDVSVKEVCRRFAGIEAHEFEALCEEYASMSESARRLESSALLSVRDATEKLAETVSREIGALESQQKFVLPDSWKSNHKGFEEEVAAVRIAYNDISAEEAAEFVKQHEFSVADHQHQLASKKTELDIAQRNLKKLQDHLENLIVEIERPNVAAAVTSDNRNDAELDFAFPEPDVISEVRKVISGFETQIREKGQRLTTKSRELSTAKTSLTAVCSDKAHGIVSSTTTSSLEKYAKNAESEHWHLEEFELQKIVTSIDSFEFSISQMADDEERSISELTNLLVKCISVFRRATNMRVPDKAGRFGGQQIMKCGFPFHQITEETKRVTAKQHLDELIERNRSEEGIVVDGPSLVNGLLMRLAAVEGKKDGFTFKILVPVIQNKTETYQDLSEMKGSGGQILTSAFLLYVLTASIRNESSGKQIGGVFLLLDNPLGAASAKELVQTQVEVATAMNIQLIIVTPSNDSDPLSCFDVLNTLHLKASPNRTVVESHKEAHDVLTAQHIYHLSDAA